MKEQPELSVEEVPTDELIPYARNAKIHTNEQIDQICSSIEEFGFNDPVAVWDGPEGTEIVAGHGRVMAAKKLGMAKVPIIRLDHMDDKERKAYGLAHNKLTMNTGWDFAKLDAELDELAGEFDMADFGFDDMDLPSDDDVEITEDEPDNDASGRVQSGELWRMGGHVLFCGDSTDAKAVGRLMSAMPSAGGGERRPASD
ncbi:ParB/Srx family N-terminal domain-containing protein [uncultured Slackia sp.]|uniref:ParB/Srx family N-terminal domain-containing protein n=1 Tax=uncultured Slackia sp. TaxID=665903 RepID=UPI0025FDAFDE|nr:ParB/Srx family N-terminal domain-containing protein [uncultured Slackia sp.]